MGKSNSEQNALIEKGSTVETDDGKVKARKAAGKVRYTLDLQSFLPYRMYRLAAQMSQAGNKLSLLLLESGVPIGEREWRVISVLGSYGGLTNGHVADALKTDAATVTRAVKVLKKLGFVDTKNSKRDRRKQLIYLTQEGADFHDLITPKRIETGELIDACFSYEEKEQLQHLLNKLDRHLHHLENELEDEWE
ncbi:MarR family transcriptional regulator [Aliikangiella marina]|uniref:MarR family transcriptional regulator n=1 Tax=Aliikangiella marina TaxID=1712262 RepID=A0A545T2S9_9GAMM|nr:MarR family transcriptional regulator [Aliikangiella marina]TQV71527.1 MarR family transcriptional regulator [Aliikangiella marina]